MCLAELEALCKACHWLGPLNVSSRAGCAMFYSHRIGVSSTSMPGPFKLTNKEVSDFREEHTQVQTSFQHLPPVFASRPPESKHALGTSYVPIHQNREGLAGTCSHISTWNAHQSWQYIRRNARRRYEIAHVFTSLALASRIVRPSSFTSLAFFRLACTSAGRRLSRCLL